MKYDIEDCLKQMDSCFNLLLPRFDLPEPHTCPSHHPFTSGQLRLRSASSESFFSLGSSEYYSEGEEEEEGEGGEGEGDVMENVNDLRSVSADGVEQQEVKGRVTTECEAVCEVKGQVTPECEAVTMRGLPSDREGGGSEGGGGEGGGGDGDSDSSDDSDVEWEDVEPEVDTLLQEHGLSSRGITIPIELSLQARVVETEDNCSIIATLRETRQLLREKFLPSVIKWMEVSVCVCVWVGVMN